ncbi:hypothetical protein Sme01_70380 [Sphaerisporangium melleum]|uniref:Chitin-binding type-4 domain-containing protein n=1 Tax=Sphaerisporangium melleum TaxID=321316 RepID=A0A917RMB7_9ACTN|nr:lytic polysaccharide monooxygenase [Sphaerisporangium melleum]GGL15469.1 hypothetical protein GCM10007964_66840 [Sphaerisporangium melleum]GII74562.1 hypothetical protein Sme01_70380 [Sphaerisporangium melleum]
MRKVVVTVTGFGLAQLLLAGPAAGPADAHGALTNPLSRAAACGVGENAALRACKAAVAASAPGALAEWDDLRVPGVAGRDREMIPDGRLCSAGLARFAGLDLPRTDWPATKLAAGAAYTFKYRATIPHKGTFRMYVTKDGYDPARPLTWSKLEREPFLRVTDPRLVAGAYTMKGRLPSGKTGRHVVYTVWQNSETPDTYYSCSDVVFAASGADGSGGSDGAGGGAQATEADAPARETNSAPGAGSAPVAEAASRPAAESGGGGVRLMAGAAVALLACAAGAVLLARRSTRRA